MENKIYSVEKIAQSTYKIDEMGRDIAYLLLGNEKALLIDSTIGAGDIKKTVEEITDLPVTVAITHGHADHTGGAVGKYKEIYVQEDDCRFIFKITNSRIYKSTLLSNRMKKAGVSIKNFSGFIWQTKWIPFKDGKTFDLGGRTVTAVHTPGHSPGCCIFLDDKEKLMFTGDNTLPYLLMTVQPCTSLEKWLEGAKKTCSLCDEYTPWSSHGDGTQTKEQIKKTISLVEEILEKYAQNKTKNKTVKYKSEDERVCVVFDESNIR